MDTNTVRINGGIISNFDAVNVAVDTEAAKRAELVSLFHSLARRNKAEMWLLVTVAVCVIALTVASCYWLLVDRHGDHVAASVATVANTQRIEPGADQRSLETILDAEGAKGLNDDPVEAQFIRQQFTVFDRVVTESGEPVVTGRVYTPDSPSIPVEQYCYVESLTAAGEIKAIRLSHLDSATGNLQRHDVPLKYESYANNYCRFVEQ